MQKPSTVSQADLDKARRKIGAVLDELERNTSSEVKDVDLEQVVDDDPETGKPTVHDSVDIDVEPRPQRRWLK